jgi:hypothetical protein
MGPACGWIVGLMQVKAPVGGTRPSLVLDFVDKATAATDAAGAPKVSSLLKGLRECLI